MKAVLTTGPVGWTLIRLTVPMVFGIAGMVAFNLVDTYFVGRLGIKPLAALGFTFPVIFIVASIALGIGTGTAAVVSRAIGSGDRERVRRLTTDGILLGLVTVGILLGLGMTAMERIFAGLGATPDIIPMILDYMNIWLPGMFFIVIAMTGNNAIRAMGDTVTPSLIMLCAVVLNLVLDPLLIFGMGPFPAMGIRGAAIATVVARALTTIVALWVLSRKYDMLTLRPPGPGELMNSWRAIMVIGFPAAAARLITPLSAAFMTRIVSAFGPAAVAAYGVSNRLEFLCLAVVMALQTIIIPFIGQNLGAGKPERVKRGVMASMVFALVWGIGVWLFMLAASSRIAPIFNDDPGVSDLIATYLTIVPIGLGLQGVFVVASAAFNAMGRPILSAGAAAVQMLGICIPAAAFAAPKWGLPGAFWAICGTYVVGGLAMGFLVMKEAAKQVAASRKPENTIPGAEKA